MMTGETCKKQRAPCESPVRQAQPQFFSIHRRGKSISPVKCCLAFGMVDHGNRIYWSNGHNWPSALTNTIVER